MRPCPTKDGIEAQGSASVRDTPRQGSHPRLGTNIALPTTTGRAFQFMTECTLIPAASRPREHLGIIQPREPTGGPAIAMDEFVPLLGIKDRQGELIERQVVLVIHVVFIVFSVV